MKIKLIEGVVHAIPETEVELQNLMSKTRPEKLQQVNHSGQYPCKKCEKVLPTKLGRKFHTLKMHSHKDSTFMGGVRISPIEADNVRTHLREIVVATGSQTKAARRIGIELGTVYNLLWKRNVGCGMRQKLAKVIEDAYATFKTQS